MDALSRLCIDHGTDKGPAKGPTRHDYSSVYARHLPPQFDPTVRMVVEIGVGGYGDPKAGGASLRVWADYWPDARVIGIDVEEKTFDLPAGVEVLQADATDPDFWDHFFDHRGPWSLRPQVVVDDGSHRRDDQVETFRQVFPRLRAGAWYVIEDLHAPQSYGPDTRYQMTAIWDLNLDAYPISEIHFYPQVLLIRKG